MAAAALACCASIPAIAAGVESATVTHLTDLVVQALPMGQMAEMAEAKDPTWPLKDKASRVSSEQLHCIREQLATVGYRDEKSHEVQAYVTAHTSSLDDDIKVLDSGAALVASKFFTGSMQAKESGSEPDRRQELRSITANQMIAYTSYEYDPKYAPLRDLVGIGSVNDPTVPADARSQAIKIKMMTLDMDLMYHAMDACQVPPATLL